MLLAVHRFAARSTVNGPGVRAVVWVQGCSLGCRGCFNPTTHKNDGSGLMNPADLAARINRLPDQGIALRGVTLTGGEPLEQADSVLRFLQALSPHFDILLFTGFTLGEIRRDPQRSAVLAACDAALLGRYRAADAAPLASKTLALLSDRITAADMTPSMTVETILSPSRLTITGLPNLKGAA